MFLRYYYSLSPLTVISSTAVANCCLYSHSAGYSPGDAVVPTVAAVAASTVVTAGPAVPIAVAMDTVANVVVPADTVVYIVPAVG